MSEHIQDLVHKLAAMRRSGTKEAVSRESADAVRGHGDWPEPGPITNAPQEIPYPLAAFPPVAEEAIMELHGYIKAPPAMIGGAVLAQMAYVGQGLVDVARDAALISPASLNVLILGESGERKTAVDRMVSQGVREWVEEEREKHLAEHRRGLAMRKALAERQQSVIKRIGGLEAKGGKEAEAERQQLEERLAELVQQEGELRIVPLPVPPFEDATPEGLVHALATGWPSGILQSDEAGIIVGGRGMSAESALSYLTTLNRMWDGRGLNQTRKQAKAAELKGRRFSVSLMLQRELIGKILEHGARGVGFFARYLICAPRSTMGRRLYSPPKGNLKAVHAFNARAKDLLSMPLPMNEQFELEPPVMHLRAASRSAWADFHDTVERQLGEYGELALVRDVAAKSAENAARIAAVLQVWGEGPSGSVETKYMDAGIALADWHLNEAVRLFFAADMPQHLQDAELLIRWLLTAAVERLDAEGRLPLAEILQRGPYQLRDKARRDAALRVLTDHEVAHVRILTINRRKLVQVNPWLRGLRGNIAVLSNGAAIFPAT